MASGSQSSHPFDRRPTQQPAGPKKEKNSSALAKAADAGRVRERPRADAAAKTALNTKELLQRVQEMTEAGQTKGPEYERLVSLLYAAPRLNRRYADLSKWETTAMPPSKYQKTETGKSECLSAGEEEEEEDEEEEDEEEESEPHSEAEEVDGDDEA
jgi:hypothetical protein